MRRPEDHRVPHGEDDGESPHAPGERQAGHLQDHRQVVGVAQVPVGAAGDRRRPRHHDDPRAPAIAQRRRPPTSGAPARRARPRPPASAQGDGGSRSGDGSERQRREEDGVEGHHHLVEPLAGLPPPAREQAARVPRRRWRARRPARRRRARGAPGRPRASHARTPFTTGAVPSRRRSRAPWRRAAPDRRGAARPTSTRSPRTKSTEAEERFPTSSSDRQERSSAPSGRPSADWKASSTLGPPVWAIQWRTSARAEPLRGQERVDVPADVLAGDAGDLGREHHLEAGVAEVPAHDPLGVGVEGATGWPRRAGRRAPFTDACTTGEHHRRRAVAEDARGHRVRDREVLPLQGERAELHREEHAHVAREAAQEVGEARQPGGAGHAAQPEDRQPLHVAPEPEPVHQLRVDGGRGEAGDGDEDQLVDVGRA